MATISEMQEEKPSLPFNASFDPSNPLGFLEKVLGFIGKESDFLLKDTADKEIASAVTAAKKRLREAEEEKESWKPFEKKLKEESVPIEVEKLKKESLKPTEPIEVEKPKEKEFTFGAIPNKWNVTLGEVPNKGNGFDFEKYSWTQDHEEVTITIPVPSGTNPRYVTCEFNTCRLKVCLQGGHNTIIDGALFGAVKPNDCFWYLEDEKVIWVLLRKQDWHGWWKYCMKGEPEIDTQRVDRKSSKLDDLDPVTRSKVEKMMFDERQKHDLKKKSMSQYDSLGMCTERRFRMNLTNKPKY
ncbi:protein BOBBER 2 [Brassica napus]|uniref:protein BOBBER 2 n=1 Tax=Brassica napus TaxID=3708 RepID=UPI00207A4312|nr:protein BOBBER 2 [Brassica napus]